MATHQNTPPSPPMNRMARASSVMSTSSFGSSMSAAEKMKAKAQAAKAARAEAKQRNPTPSRRSSSVAPPSQPTQTQDISVPTLLPTDSGSLDAITQFMEDSLRNGDDFLAPTNGNPTQADIPVPSGSNISQLSPPRPTSTAITPINPDESSKQKTISKARQPKKSKQPATTEETSVVPKKKARAPRKPKATPVHSEPASSSGNKDENEEEEDISPRMRRKRHLLKLRAEKRQENGKPIQSSPPLAPRRRASPKLFNDSSVASGDDDSARDENFEASDAELDEEQEEEDRPKKRKKTPQVKAPKRVKAQKKARKVKIKGMESISEEEDEDAPIDPTKVTLNILCAPDSGKGRGSEALNSRMKLVIERRQREKAERIMLRAEQKKRKRRIPAERPDVREDSEALDEEEVVEQVDEEVENDTDARSAATAAAEARKSLAESYGLEDLDSDEDMENFEEVVFDEFASSSRTKKKQPAPQVSAAPLPGIEEEEEEEVVEEEMFDEDDVPEARQYAPQLRVVNGQIVLDQDSLQVDRQEDQEDRLNQMEIVEESDATRLVNSNTWSTGIRGERWSADETSLFFDAVRMFGSDFEMIAQLFPGRHRKQIRLKWIKEEKKAPDLMTDLMMGRTTSRARSTSATPSQIEEEPDDEEGSEIVELTSLTRFEEYAKLVGIDCSGPIPEDPMDKWREKERLEDEELRKQATAAKTKDTTGERDEDEEEDEEEEVVEEEFNTAGWGELE